MFTCEAAPGKVKNGNSPFLSETATGRASMLFLPFNAMFAQSRA